MKIAIFTDTFLPQVNGVAKTLGKYQEYLEENNVDFRIFAPEEDCEDLNSKIIRFFSIKFLLYPELKFAFPNNINVFKKLDEFKPDIIHVVTPFSIGLSGLIYAKSRNIPLVSSYHTNIPQYLKYFKIDFLESITWNFFRWFHSKCIVNYCPSMDTLQELSQNGIQNLELWGRGIDRRKYSPVFRGEEYRKKLKAENKRIVLFVGRVSPEKDVRVFIDTAKKLNQKYIDKLHFVVVGDGPLLESLKDEKIDNLTLEGFVRGKALSQIYASCDIFMFPSPSETYGNVIIEAMASGLAVVACNERGIKENLIHNYNGIACREKVIDDYYGAVEKLLLDEKYRITIAKNGLEYTEGRSWDGIFNNLLNSYSVAIEKYKSKRDKRKIA